MVLLQRNLANPRQTIEDAIFEKYGELYAVFEDVVTDSEATIKKLGLSKKAGEALVHIAHESVKIPKVEVTGQWSLCPQNRMA